MIARSGKDNFLVAHYDWVAAGVGACALVAAAAYCFLGGSVGEEIAERTGRIRSAPGKGVLVADEDMRGYAAATNASKARARAAFVLAKIGPSAADLARKKELSDGASDLSDADRAEKKRLAEKAGAGSFLSSDRRLLCASAACGRLTPAKLDAGGNLVCSFCGFTQEVAKVETVVADRDGDGMPDEWERRYGLDVKANDADLDKDGDLFTNLEEYLAKDGKGKRSTDPTDKSDHPDCLDTLTVRLPLKETFMPFVFTKATKIPAGWRCEFFNAQEKDDYGRAGRTTTAVVGEEIGKSGFLLKGYEEKSTRVAIKGGAGLKKTVDVSEATVERKKDGKKIKLVIVSGKKAKPMAVDVQATLASTLGGGRTFVVIAGSEFTLGDAKCRVVEIRAEGQGARVTVEDAAGKKREIRSDGNERDTPAE